MQTDDINSAPEVLYKMIRFLAQPNKHFVVDVTEKLLRRRLIIVATPPEIWIEMIYACFATATHFAPN